MGLNARTMTEGSDAVPPPGGPGFLHLHSWIYRLEYAMVFIAIAWLLFGWRLLILKDFSLLAIGLTLFWFIWPDVAAFVPIGFAMRGRRQWPRWGSTLYNWLHTFLTWGAVFAIWSVARGSIQWPLLGWAAHLAMDRAVGFTLRAPV